jgi:hypothetical protein
MKWALFFVGAGTVMAVTVIALVPNDIGRVFAENAGRSLAAAAIAFQSDTLVYESTAPKPIAIPVVEQKVIEPLVEVEVVVVQEEEEEENVVIPVSLPALVFVPESSPTPPLPPPDTLTLTVTHTKTSNIYDPVPISSPGFGGGGGGGGGGGSFSGGSSGSGGSGTESVPAPAPAPTPSPVAPTANAIVFNEIAWRGTEANTNDEWIELYNRTSNTISLASTTLHSTDGSPYIALSGTLAPYSYYLVERKNGGETNETSESPIADITADLWVSFGDGLSDGANGERLYLAYFDGTATTTIDEVNFSGCFQSWCGKGGTDFYYSMERRSPELSGLTSAGWTSNRGDRTNFKNGTDQNGTALRATPKQRNYANFLVNYGNELSNGTLTLSPSGGPYLIDSEWFTVPSGATLALQAGTVVKVNGNGGVRVNGSLNVSGAVGTTTGFTSYKDDAMGGDFNRDAAATTPAAGEWLGLEYLAGSSGTIDRGTLRYGGRYSGIPSPTKALVYAIDASPTVTNSTIEYSKEYGISLVNASSTISNNTIRYQNDAGSSYGIYGYGGAPTISGNTLASNTSGMIFWNSSGAFTGNTFTSNSSTAFTWGGDLLSGGSISGNSGSGNGASNGITLQSGNLMTSGVSSSFGKNTLFPYLISSAVSVPAGATLIVDAGSVWKFGNAALTISGSLDVNGTTGEQVLFTSLSDDADGNDAQGNASTTPAILTNSGVYMQAGAVSDFLNTTIRYMKIGASYAETAPISLENVLFSHNETGVSAHASTTVSKALNVSFASNVATSTVPL